MANEAYDADRMRRLIEGACAAARAIERGDADLGHLIPAHVDLGRRIARGAALGRLEAEGFDTANVVALVTRAR